MRVKTRIRAKRSILLTFALAALVGTASASQFARFDRDTQVRGSELILRGRVGTVSAHWNQAHSAIFSDAEVTVDEVWKGIPESDRVTVRVLGGTVGTVRLEVDGAPQFAAGEEVVLFLRRTDGAYTPWGMVFGKFRIVGTRTAAVAVGLESPSGEERETFRPYQAKLSDLRREVVSMVAKGAR